MLRSLVTALMAAGLALSVSMPAGAYDQELAKSYARLFEPVQGMKAGKHLNLMKAEEFVAKVKAGVPMVGLDVRTPVESQVFTTALPGSLAIPINELFTAENLERLPADKTIVVVCKSGTRATAVGTALRHVGFDNVYILKGGYKALSAYLDAKTANMPLGPKQAAR